MQKRGKLFTQYISGSIFNRKLQVVVTMQRRINYKSNELFSVNSVAVAESPEI